ncbi:MAG: SIS domain-containing protein [Alphaproteobacteria bacterium]|nr:MAG: SIS domain-containing protein [Alphaproteobacteria bacterium]|tara:strand:- start:2207 stop:2782 length:576 start_codon:yes stop_codon:yes gene_type:complete
MDNSLEIEFKEYLDECSHNIDNMKSNLYLAIEKSINYIKNSINSGGKIIFFGNGGSASDSQHLCAEFVGRYKKDRSPLAAISLNTDTSILTAVANDMGYEKVFERQVEALAKKEDVIFAISTSGSSKNVINAVVAGKKKGIKIIALTGKKDSELSNLSDVSIKVPSDKVNHIQEMHIIIGHFICEIIEKNI